MEPLNKRQIVFRVTVPIFSVVILLIALEIFARLYLAVFSLPRTHYDFRKGRPAPYSDAAYFSKEFISESFRQPGGWQYPKGTGLIIPNEYKGTYFNVVNGRRYTAFQPETHRNTVYLFGGSSIYNAEVPDDLTVASQLQLLLNTHYGDRYVVQNYGTHTVTVVQQLERLKTCSPQPGDVVIFYDGVNDISMGLFYANSERTMLQRNRRTIEGMSLFRRFMFALSRRSKFAEVFFDPVDRSIPPHFSDDALMKELRASMKFRFRKAIEEADDYSGKRKAVFIHFLQPHLFAHERMSEYETQLSGNFFIVPRGIRESLLMGYPELKAATRELSPSIPCYDLSGVLNERPDKEEYFLDSCHVTHKANRIIAGKIFDSLHDVVSRDTRKKQRGISG